MQDDLDYKKVIQDLIPGHINITLSQCVTGGNNRAFRVDTDTTSYFAKWYFKSKEDNRNRLENEWNFLEYAKLCDIHNLPQPIAKTPEHNIAIYSFLEGVQPKIVDGPMVSMAAELVQNLNQNKYEEYTKNIDNASESCLTADSHIKILEAHISRLEQGDSLAQYKDQFAKTLQDMQAMLSTYKTNLYAGYENLGIEKSVPLTKKQLCLSPSDFGFHNSLVANDGNIQFIDFEYAGWDDPAKMICDFFLHPGIPVDKKWLPIFWEKIKYLSENNEELLSRTKLLYPLLGLKWCCIILNVFIPQWSARRQFANKNWDITKAQAEQLEKAHNMLYTLQQNIFGEL